MPALTHRRNNSDNNAVYVGNLPFELALDELTPLMSPFGAVSSISGNAKRGFAVVTFESPQAARRAVQARDPLVLGGRQLRLEHHGDGAVQVLIAACRDMDASQPLFNTLEDGRVEVRVPSLDLHCISDALESTKLCKTDAARKALCIVQPTIAPVLGKTGMLVNLIDCPGPWCRRGVIDVVS